MLLQLPLAVRAQAANTLYVNPDGTGDYTTIQEAIYAAGASGGAIDTIVVAAGTYRESLQWWNTHLTIQGAGPGQSIIDPSIDPLYPYDSTKSGPGGRCLYTQNLGADSTIEGFTFQGGQSTSQGGGMENSFSDLTVTNCAFSGNTAYGGGAMANLFGSPRITHCTFTSNHATNEGGGMANYNGSSATVTNCTFNGNQTDSYGGAMYNDSSTPRVTNCTFSANSSPRYGGGMANNNSSSPRVTNCTFVSNSATYSGGAMYNTGSTPTLTNCILWANTANYGGAGILDNFSSSTNLYHTASQDLLNSSPDTAGNFNAYPAIVRYPLTFGPSDYGDLRLQASSPCIDAGDNAAVAGIPADLDGNARIAGGTVDLGAYEFGAGPYVPDVTAPTLSWDDPNPAPNAAGWNNTAVDIPFTTDDDSGVAPTASTSSPVHFDAEGAGQTQKVTVTDAAGNSADFTSSAVNIDMTKPATSGSVSGSTNGTVTLSASDSLSGLKATYYTVDGGAQQTYNVLSPFTLPQGQHTVQYWSVDNAGNIEDIKTLPIDTRIAVTVAVTKVSGKRGGTVTLSATVTQIGTKTKLAGVIVGFTIDGTLAAGTATTNRQGVASLSWTIPTTGVAAGAHTLTATAVDATHKSADASATLTVR